MNNQTQQMAEFAVGLVNRADIKGGDAENTLAVKQWLSSIARGDLVVGKPVVEDPSPPAQTAK